MNNQKPSIASNRRTKWHQGSYTPRCPEKYIGNAKSIVYRSKWELVFLKWCDETPDVVKYSSEECVIPYISPVDGQKHRYFVDFFVQIRQGNELKNFLVEIKPYGQTQPPKPPRKGGTLSESYQEACRTYLVNQAKWEAARAVCAKRGWEFMVLTEKELFRPRRKNGR